MLISAPALMVSLILNPASADTEGVLIVHEFEVNGHSDNFVIGTDEAVVVRGVVENTGSDDTTIELVMNGRYHYERWEIEAGATKELESGPYEHHGWYEGVFLMALGEKEIEIEVVERSDEGTGSHINIHSFTANGGSGLIRIEENDFIKIDAKLTNEGDETVEVDLVFKKRSEAQPMAQPWPYVKLDVEEVRLLGHKGHYENSCSYGAFNAIVEPLKREIGHPYTQVPTYMLHFGRGGFVGEGSVCGALIGAVAALNLIAGEDYRPLGEELIKYYKEEELPTAIWDEYLEMENSPIDPEMYVAESMDGSISPTVDCGDSLETWYEEAGEEQGPRRNERCGRLTGDVAARAAELLNEWYENRDNNEQEHTVLPVSDAIFHKTYEVMPGESLRIDEAIFHDWEAFERYTVTLKGHGSQESIKVVVSEERERSNNIFYLVTMMILIFIAGMVSGQLMKKN